MAGGDTIEHNFIGTDPTGTLGEMGTTAEGNQSGGVIVQANCNNNSILNNLVSGNPLIGILLNGTASGSSTTLTSGNLVAGNLIGTDVTGTLGLANEVDAGGIVLVNATATTIGGTTAAARNLISGNNIGIAINSYVTDLSIEGNYIGTDITGSVGLGNRAYGFTITVGATGIANLTIGGTTAGSGNVFSASGISETSISPRTSRPL